MENGKLSCTCGAGIKKDTREQGGGQERQEGQEKQEKQRGERVLGVQESGLRSLL